MLIHVAELGQNGPAWGQHPHAAAASELCETLSAIGLSRTELAHLLGYSARTVRHWTAGDRAVSRETIILLRLVRAGKLTVIEISAAAAQLPHDLEPVMRPAADQEGAAIGIGIDQLDSRVCRWPLWEDVPRDARLGDQMRFCGGHAVVGSSYCSEHAAMAARRNPGRPRSTLASPATGGVMNSAHRL
jgi:hypothetical protein